MNETRKVLAKTKSPKYHHHFHRLHCPSISLHPRSQGAKFRPPRIDNEINLNLVLYLHLNLSSRRDSLLLLRETFLWTIDIKRDTLTSGTLIPNRLAALMFGGSFIDSNGRDWLHRGQKKARLGPSIPKRQTAEMNSSGSGKSRRATIIALNKRDTAESRRIHRTFVRILHNFLVASSSSSPWEKQFNVLFPGRGNLWCNWFVLRSADQDQSSRRDEVDGRRGFRNYYLRHERETYHTLSWMELNKYLFTS